MWQCRGGVGGATQWARCDDEKVFRVSEEDVLKQPAYVLVYGCAT